MGQFRVTVLATGNNGCQRDKGDGQIVIGCERPGCVDCITREFVRRLKRAGCVMERADLIHWPDTTYKVHDDLLAGIRVGEFK
jgi:hypothetical protein